MTWISGLVLSGYLTLPPALLLLHASSSLASSVLSTSSSLDRFRYLQGPALVRDAKEIMPQAPDEPINVNASRISDFTASKSLLPKAFRGDPSVDDAFSTILQWLYYRIPFTR